MLAVICKQLHSDATQADYSGVWPLLLLSPNMCPGARAAVVLGKAGAHASDSFMLDRLL